QAEDGIRDLIVTGVQTCALPIWAPEKQRVCIDVGLTHPIAWIRRIDVAPIAVVAARLVGIGDEVITGEDAAGAEVGVVEDTGVEIGRASCRERGEVSGGAGGVEE